ncbi:MAG: hypothetical protein ABJA37_08140 [Ferruginibacter sp.]
MKPVSILFCSLILIIGSCRNGHQYDIATDKYENTKESLAQTEQKNPARFLSVEGNNKKNLLGQMVIRGKVSNNAKVVAYKDIDIKLSFYSKTGTLLEEDHETVYETVHPGASSNFKSKYFAPKGSDSVALHIAGAKY